MISFSTINIRRPNVMNVRAMPMTFIEKAAIHNYRQLGDNVPLHVMCDGVLVAVVQDGIFTPVETLVAVGD